MSKAERPREASDVAIVPPRIFHALWLCCQQIKRDGPVAINEVCKTLFPQIEKKGIKTVQQWSQVLNLWEHQSNSAVLTATGKALARAPHWREWDPGRHAHPVLRRMKSDNLIGLQAVTNRPKIIDLFSGAGGLGLGFEKAGFHVAVAVDNDLQSVEAHRTNFPEAEVDQQDITKIAQDPVAWLNKTCHLKPSDICGVVGGPPCQGFSSIGERVVTDERNMLTSRFMDVVLKIKPKFFVMENVAGLKSIGIRPSFEKYLADYCKPIGPAAKQIATDLPAHPGAANKRERQYNKRLISRCIQEFTDKLKTVNSEKHKQQSPEQAVGELSKHMTSWLEDAFSDLTEFNAASFIRVHKTSIVLIALSLHAPRAVPSQDTGTQAYDLISGLTDRQDEIGSVARELIHQFTAMPTGSNYKGVVVGPILINLIRRAGAEYEVAAPKVLSAAWYGTPQDRRRMFLVGIRKDLNCAFEFPSRTHLFPGESKSSASAKLFAPTCKNAIGDLPNIDKFEDLIASDKLSYHALGTSPGSLAAVLRGEAFDLYDMSLPRPTWNPFSVDCCKRTLHSAHVLERLKDVHHGVLDKTSGKTRLKPDDVSHTLRAGTKEAKGSHTAVRPIHYTEDRVISVREGARLMGFPDWMTFHPTKWHGFRLVGNGVPAELGRAVAAEIRDRLYPTSN